MPQLEIHDQMGRRLNLPDLPKRIISIVPSQTELIHFLASDRLIARTHFCIHPEEIKALPSVGGTKKLQLDKIREFNPDLIIGNKEENEQSQIEELEKEFPVWMSDISTVDDALEMMLSLGVLLNVEEKARQLVQTLKDSLDRIESKASRFNQASVLYFIWRNPWMLAGKSTFIDHILSTAGFNPICREERYPELKNSQESPELIFLSSEPYPFKEEHISELRSRFPEASIHLVDGEVFSWYGNRLLDLEPYLYQLEEDIKKAHQ